MNAAVRQTDLVAEAWQLPVAKLYSPLQSQTFVSICGPTSVSNVLRSIQGKARNNPLRGFGLRAMTLDQLVGESAEVLPNGWSVEAVRPTSVSELRAELLSSNDPDRRYVANFVRSAIFGRGGGHHSPIGGYLQHEDLVFVLDVNASFGPWLVPTEKLFDALGATDWSSDQPRGLARYQRRNKFVTHFEPRP